MNHLGHLCRELYNDMNLTQRQLAQRLGISLGKCNRLAHEAEEKGYISVLPGARGLTTKGRKYLEEYRVKNAVILAAGIDIRFVPFTHEVPKCMIRIEGERIIERNIQQLKDKGIDDITVVVGYLAEKFEYLAGKYGVKLLYNPEYANRGNLSSVYLARHLLGNTYLLAADQWIWENIYHVYEPEPWCACHWHEGPTGRYCLETNGKRRLRSAKLGGTDKLAMLGPVYFDESLSAALVEKLEQAYVQPENEAARWQVVLKNAFLEQHPFYARILPAYIAYDFATLEELRDFDTGYLETSGNKNLGNIARIFSVPESRITGLKWLDVGMTNQSFVFTLDGAQYIYRIPGDGSENFISRRQEYVVYEAIKPLGISDEVVYFNPDSGIKVARYYANSNNVKDDAWEDVKVCMQILRKLHQSKLSVDHSFDILKKMDDFEKMCRNVNCIHFEDFEQTRQTVQLALDIIQNSSQPQVLCHGDSAHVNFLKLQDGSIRLLDWEYGGMCHGVADVAMFGVFSNYPFQQIDELLEWYYGRTPTPDERLLCFSYVAASGLLWSLWAEYREYYGENFGEYPMQQYRIAKQGALMVQRLLQQREGGKGRY